MSAQITVCRSITHSDNSAEVAHQIVPVVAVVGTYDLVLSQGIRTDSFGSIERLNPYLHAEQLLHTQEDRYGRVLDDGDSIER